MAGRARTLTLRGNRTAPRPQINRTGRLAKMPTFPTEFNLPSVPPSPSRSQHRRRRWRRHLPEQNRTSRQISIPNSVVDFSTAASLVDNAIDRALFCLRISLVKGRNVLAAEVHQVSGTSSDIVFGVPGPRRRIRTRVHSRHEQQRRPRVARVPPIWISEVQPHQSSWCRWRRRRPQALDPNSSTEETPQMSLEGWTF